MDEYQIRQSPGTDPEEDGEQSLFDEDNVRTIHTLSYLDDFSEVFKK
jgi:hypothetical protein